jgi:PAS domain S-box-containing protein
MTHPDRGEPIDAERYRQLVEAVPDHGIFLLDAQGHVVSWTVAAERITGHRADEVLGQHLGMFYPEDTRAQADRHLRQAAAQGKCEDEGWRVRKDGSLFWTNALITPLYDDAGSLTGFGHVARDLTERKTLELAQQENAERFRLLVDGVLDYAIYMLSPDGIIQSWNRGAELIKGYTADEVIGQHYRMFFKTEDAEQGFPAWQLQRALLHGRTEEEGWRVRKDGTAFWANIIVTPIYGKNGSLAGYAKVTRDTTERSKLRELSHSLQQMNEFLAMLAHELRNPLAPMRNVIELLQREASPSVTVKISRDILDRQLNHLTRLMDELLDAGRLTSGKIHIKPERISFKHVTTQAVEAVWPAIHGRDQTFHLDAPPNDIVVNADEMRLVQVMQNLLSNASKFTPEGGRIELRSRCTSGRLCVSVADNGQGMTPQEIHRIFALFSQGDRVKETHHAGLGIGLALARSIVEMHGGTITATSAGVGRGSVLSFELPGASEETPAGA